MALKQPGTRSNATFLVSGTWALSMIVILVAGHLVLGFLVYAKFTGEGGMEEIASFTSIPEWALWLSIIAALAMDGWIIYSQQQERLKANKR